MTDINPSDPDVPEEKQDSSAVEEYMRKMEEKDKWERKFKGANGDIKEQAKIVESFIKSMFPDEDTITTLRKITRLTSKETFLITCGGTMDSIRSELYGPSNTSYNRYEGFIIDLYANRISKKGEGRKESIEVTQAANEADRRSEERSFLDKLMGRNNNAF